MKKMIACLLAAALCLSLAACRVESIPMDGAASPEGSAQGAPGSPAQPEAELTPAEKAEKYADALALLRLTGELWTGDSFAQAVALFDKYEGFDLTYDELKALFEDAPKREEGADITGWEEAYAAWE